LETFTLATFAPRLGETFRIRADAQTLLDLVLVEATDLSGPAGAGGAERRPRAPFSIVFRGPPAPLLPQRIYGLEHDRLGAFDLFLVPIGPDAQGMRYEAVFA
jgi:hypothetical protein